MSKMKLALDVVTDLRNLAGSIETLVLALEGNQSTSAPLDNSKKERNEGTKEDRTIYRTKATNIRGSQS